MRKASFLDSYKLIGRMCVYCVYTVHCRFSLFRWFSKPNIFYYDYCYDFIICLLFKFNVEPLMISNENKLHTHISQTVIMNKKKKERKKMKTEWGEENVRRTTFSWKMRRIKSFSFNNKRYQRIQQKKTANGITQEEESILYRDLALLLRPFFVLARTRSFFFLLPSSMFFFCIPLWRSVAFSVCSICPIVRFNGWQMRVNEQHKAVEQHFYKLFWMCVFSWTHSHTDYFIHQILLFSFDFRIFCFWLLCLSPPLSPVFSFFLFNLSGQCQSQRVRAPYTNFGWIVLFFFLLVPLLVGPTSSPSHNIHVTEKPTTIILDLAFFWHSFYHCCDFFTLFLLLTITILLLCFFFIPAKKFNCKRMPN